MRTLAWRVALAVAAWALFLAACVATAAVLAGCTSEAPVASLCLFHCTVVVRTDSAGDDALTWAEVEARRNLARDVLKHAERKAQAPP